MKNQHKLQPSLSEVIAWVTYAGEILHSGFYQEHQIQFKNEIDLVTEMDQKSKKYLIEQIQDHFPNHAIVTEESGLINENYDFC